MNDKAPPSNSSNSSFKRILCIGCLALFIAYVLPRNDKTSSTCTLTSSIGNDTEQGQTQCKDDFFHSFVSKRFINNTDYLKLRFFKLLLAYTTDEGLIEMSNVANMSNVFYAEVQSTKVELKLNVKSLHGYQRIVSVAPKLKNINMLGHSKLVDYNKNTNEVTFILNKRRAATWVIQGKMCLPMTDTSSNTVKFRLGSDFSLVISSKVSKNRVKEHDEEENIEEEKSSLTKSTTMEMDKKLLCQHFTANGFTNLEKKSRVFFITSSTSPNVTVFIHNWSIGTF